MTFFDRVREIVVREGAAALVERGLKEKWAGFLRGICASKDGYWAVRDVFEDVASLVPSAAPIIVDGGAYRGRAIDGFLEVFESPEIIAFEPIPQLSAELENRYEHRSVRVIQRALGARNRDVQFHVTQNILSSSVLEPSQLKRAYHGRSVDVREKIIVREVRLDDMLDGHVDILKLDLQGYELEALRGCEEFLGSIRALIVEVEFAPLYEGQPLFTDLSNFLIPRGFQLFNLYEPYTESDGRLGWADAVFCRESALARRNQ